MFFLEKNKLMQTSKVGWIELVKNQILLQLFNIRKINFGRLELIQIEVYSCHYNKSKLQFVFALSIQN